VLIDHDDQQHHGFEIGHGMTTWTSVSWTNPPGHCPASPQHSLIALATLISAPGPLIVASTLFACISSAACGIIMVIRIEQLNRQASGPGRPGNKRG